MINLWLTSGTAGIVLIPFVLLYLVAAGIVWLTHLSPARPFFASCVGIAGPFFASVAVLFALFAAFLSNEVQHDHAALKAAVFREADGVRTILRLAEALGEVGKPIQTATLNYTEAVVTKELPGLRDHRNEDLGALRSLSLAALAPGLATSVPAAAHQAILDGLVEVRQARLERVTLLAGSSGSLNWLAMIVLGILTQAAVAIVQLERLRPQALALFVFSTAFAATVALIGLAEQPFAARQVDDAPLRAAVASSTP
jgi:hypothetical protein